MARDAFGGPHQWRFLGPDGYLRPDVPMALRDDATGSCLGSHEGRPVWVEAAGGVSVHRAGARSQAGAVSDAVTRGERLALRIGPDAYLVATARSAGAEPRVQLSADPSFEWELTGVAPGAAIAADRPVGLFNLVQGDFLVAAAGPDAAAGAGDAARGAGPLCWWAETGSGLPAPSWARPPEGAPGDVELAGAMVPVVDGDPGAGLLLLLDRDDATRLGEHTGRRAPDLADAVAPQGQIGALACRWATDGGPASADDLPPAGGRLWVQGPLLAEPGPAVHPVRSLAWVLDGEGHAVEVAPGDPGWPETLLAWQLLLLPTGADDAAPHRVTVWSLPLPGQDGEAGSTTTFTLQGPRVLTGVPPSLVHDPRTGRRGLRIELARPAGGGQVRLACVARVHLRRASAEH